MKTKGFTLVELLGVIIILSLLMLVVLPKITNSTRNSSTKTDKLTEDLIFKATDLYLRDNEVDYAKIDNSIYCISLSNLVSSEYLKSPIKMSYSDNIINSKVVEASYNNGYSYELKDKSVCVTKTQPNKPDLLNNSLTPIKYDGTNWKVVDGSKTDWYDYYEQEWANAVILNKGIKKSIGDIVDVTSEAKAMFVWIPRYEYKIDGTYGRDGTSATAPGEIEVNFVLKTKAGVDGDYRVHPAFTFGKKQLSGIWVGKFETGHTTLSSSTTNNNLGCSNENCTNADGLVVLPNVVSLRNNNVSNLFYAARSMTRSGNPFGFSSSNVDTHMMKNSEWGAVAYLSQSKYGKYGNVKYSGAEKEVRINNCLNYITGIGANSQNEDETSSTCTTNTYETENGQAASTTGNITGVYDLSGGNLEYVMGVYNQTIKDSGFSTLPDEKYYDNYTTTSATTACSSGVCYGHALSETLGWYEDSAIFPTDDPWFGRGGFYNGMSNAGAFHFTDLSGGSGYMAFRVVLAPTTN